MSNELKHIPWPGWELVREIGRGTFGTVYEVRHDLITEEERAALKVISVPQNPSEIKSMRAEGQDNDSITRSIKDQAGRILQEYTSLRDLQGTPNIVRCNAVHHEPHADGIGVDVYILMELLTPLLDKVDELLKTEDQIINFGIDMCNALIACEKKKILHRDIKPENIFVSQDGIYKLGDFGVARSHDHTTYGTMGVGTPTYMAPEVANGGEYNKQADIYSLGIVLYWLLNKRRTPFLPLPPKGIYKSDREEAFKRRCSGEAIPTPVNGSEELKEIVLKACAFDLKDRYQSAADMLADLSALGGAPVVVALPVPDRAKQETVSSADSAEEDVTVGPTFEKALAKEKVEETVGPAFTPVDTDEAEDQEKTVGPAFLPQDGPTQPQKKKRAWPLVAAAVLVVIIGIMFWPVYGEWSEWSPQKPDNEKGRKLETELQYRYRQRSIIESETPLDDSEEVNLLKQWQEWSEYGGWSDWSQDEVIAADDCEVESERRYRSREISVNESYTDWSEWSGWSTISATQSDTVDVQTRTVYCYSAYRYKCNICDKTLPGATLTMLSHAKSHGLDGQLDPLRSYISGNEEKNVSLSEAIASANCSYVSTTLTGINQKLSVDTSSGNYSINSGGVTWYTGSAEPSKIEKQYNVRSRELEKIEVYSEWTDYTTEVLKEDGSTQVESKVFYRYRTRSMIEKYQYEIWSDWSKWEMNPETVTADMDLEQREVYRYADRCFLWERIFKITKPQ